MRKISICCVLFLASYFLGGCQRKQALKITGHIDYVGSSKIFVSKQPLHYKYSPKKQFPIHTSGNGKFEVTVPLDSTQIIQFYVDDKSYPLLGQPGQKLNLKIYRETFPDSVQVSGYSFPYDSLYAEFYEQEQPLEDQIQNQLPAFRNGDSSAVVPLYQQKYQLARDFFFKSPLKPLYYQAVGEYLVKRLQSITYRRGRPDLNPQNARQAILSEAKKLNFFSFESLHAQRAGIRDFTNAFANTFGVADSLESQYDQELMQYDVKRLGYDKLDSARTAVLNYIDGRKARAYAQMYLVAERIGEMPLDIAKPSYQKFLDEYAKDFPQYTSFLKTFYKRIERVSPGHPAVPFSIKDANGHIRQMKDYRGKYVLLDFWASWCIPCLDEFPYMKKIYDRYSREKFEILGISIEEDSLRWRQTLQQFQNPWPQLYGGNEFQQKTFHAYRGGGIPFYILVDPKGDIVRYNDVRPSFNLPAVLDSLINQYNFNKDKF